MRYVIGIDLGTTNSCVAYADTQTSTKSIQNFRIPQITVPGYVEPLSTLPSFCYIPTDHEFAKDSINLPWSKSAAFIVGSFAQSHGSRVPGRLVESAKSWLCHASANRKDRILPFAADEIIKISPVEATTRYLQQIKDAWNYQMARQDPEAQFEQQEVILTVPASFDEVARGLTVEAAKKAGFLNLTLLEEPQAAFYSWIAQHEGKWESVLKPGDTILVCDVGGGTTDFSLIEVIVSSGKIGFRRMSVGDHLLLGGDNMDAAIAHYLEQKTAELTSLQRQQLRHLARQAKETLMSGAEDEIFKIHLQGTGSKVIQGSLSLDLTAREVRELLLDGFFGKFCLEEAVKLKKASGIRTMGLPFEAEPSITKHMAHFLVESGSKGPDYLLFNGGAMKPRLFQEALLRSLQNWFPNKSPSLLETVSLDLAVSRGAAYYGKVRRGLGVRIGGGAPRSYYMAIDVHEKEGVSSKALTLLPRGVEEGASYESEQIFWLKPNLPVAFQLFSSHVRLHDKSGDIISIENEQMHPLPPIQTVLHFGKGSEDKIPVHLHIQLTPIGTLEIWLKSQKTSHKWALEFQLKNASGQDDTIGATQKRGLDETFDQEFLKSAQTLINQAFSPGTSIKSAHLMEKLETVIGKARKDWPPSVLRGLWDTLIKCASNRKSPNESEARWWNLAGFLLRPGYGYPLDDFRIKELWKIVLADFKAAKTSEVRIQSWICFRRIAGGLNRGQQAQLAGELFPPQKLNRLEFKNGNELYHYSEKVRAFGALELIELSHKIKLGNAILSRMRKGEAVPADYWALGRIGARHLSYGSAQNVVPASQCSDWVETLLQLEEFDREQLAFTFSLLARKTDQADLNLPQKLAERILEAYPELRERLLEDKELTLNEQEQIFGDRLPYGLSLNLH